MGNSGSSKVSVLCERHQHQPSERSLVSDALLDWHKIKLIRGVAGRSLSLLRTLGIVFFVGLFLADSLQAFTIISNAGKPARWANGEVSFVLYGVPTEFHSAIDSSFGVWESVSNTNLNITNLGTTTSASSSQDGNNTISWIDSNWRNLSFRPPSNALAVTLSSFSSSTGLVVDADIFFNAEYFDWKVVDPSNSDDGAFVDVQNISTHEVGHLLGLDHSSQDYFETDDDLYEATMYYASGTGETSRRTPKSDDINGIRSIYPSEAQAAARINSVELVEQTGSYYVYRVEGENFGVQTSFVISTGDTSELDRVSRYKTILDENTAEVEFYLSGFDQSDAYFIAMNDTSSVSSVQVNLFIEGENTASSSNGLSAASGGGGGGCSAQADSGSSQETWFLLALGLLLILVSQFRGKRQKLK